MKKRFIAGAVCPRCGELDRLVTFEEKGEAIKECVTCGFSEKQLVQVQVGELETRVNKVDGDSNKDEPLEQPVKILPRSSK